MSEGPVIHRVPAAHSGAPQSDAPAYTFGTLVTRPQQYAAMLASFRAGGFSDADCEFLYIDNTSGPQTDAYRGLNALLDAARAPIVILCHQDLLLLNDGRATLDARLADLSGRDPAWAVAGNAGGVAPGRLALRISDPHGDNQHTGALPQRVATLDENLLIVRRAARAGFSHDLSGFHFYGADLCLHAELLGCSAWVIDFHLRHLSPGNKDASFYAAETAFKAKWAGALSPRWLQTTCALMHITPSPLRAAVGRVIDAPLARLMRRRPGARGWKTTGPKTA